MSKVVSGEPESDLDAFQPVPLTYPKRNNVSTATHAGTPPKSGKGKQPLKHKVKEYQLTLVGLPRMMSRVTFPSERHVHEVWARATARNEGAWMLLG